MLIDVPDVTGRQAGDIAVTAAEGGVNYWARVSGYEWQRWDPSQNGVADPGSDFVFFSVTYENPTGPGVGHADITPKLIAEGVKIALSKRVIRKDLVEQLLDGITSGDIGEVDAEVSDCVIQLGVFGEVVFG